MVRRTKLWAAAAAFLVYFVAFPLALWGPPGARLEFPERITDPSAIPVKLHFRSWSGYYKISGVRFVFDLANSSALDGMAHLFPLAVEARRPMPEQPSLRLVFTYPRTDSFEFVIDLVSHAERYHDDPAFASGKDAAFNPVYVTSGTLNGRLEYRAEWARPSRFGWDRFFAPMGKVNFKSEVITGR